MMKIRLAHLNDYSAILQLQQENIPENLSDEQKKQGFIVSRMDEKQLAAINNDLGILVAEDDNGEVAGFVCMMKTDARPRPPVVDAMLEALRQQRFEGKPLTELRVFLYGPVCVAQNKRGQGIVSQLLAEVKQHTQANYDVGAAFVDDANPHSLAVHVKGLHMTPVTNFTCHQKGYNLLVFSTRS
ncbi:GNAT family N-acetyltransferase [Yersinia entomophaga]